MPILFISEVIMYCSYCGKYYNEKDQPRFCSNCGAKIKSDLIAATSEFPPQKEQSAPNAKTISPQKNNTNTVSDRWAWFLAFMPNYIFGLLDMFHIKDKMKVRFWQYLWLFFVPAYLFVRAAKTNKKYGYAIASSIYFTVYVTLIILITTVA